ncbi:MAG TPA: LysM peptidoglycan-binding domain-containing protein, partial [Verrucomicrobiota bacterium]|nr:LysM peptidoglycan-binding domain-containing protein [Verrucomicrobiota bacterium]
MDRRLNRDYRARLAIIRVALGLLLCAVGAPMAAGAAETIYIVKRGDSVYSIGRRYGVSPAVLAERNGLNRNFYISAGQRLRIPARRVAPAKKPAAKPPPPSVLPRAVRVDDSLSARELAKAVTTRTGITAAQGPLIYSDGGEYYVNRALAPA